jgi:NTP pyrophosphatase (non-canonical NTP hydrolase)
MLTLDGYQVEAAKTAIYPKQFSIMYPALGISAEAGEVANKVKKIYRDKDGRIDEASRLAIADEVGDVLWYLACLSSDLGIDLSQVAQRNLDKLYSRLERGVLGGSGDNR